MRLLFDQSLAPRLVRSLADPYSDSVHVRDVGRAIAEDAGVWEDAKQLASTIVSKDGDLHHRSFLYGHPPNVIWIRRGNCSTTVSERMLRNPVAAVLALA